MNAQVALAATSHPRLDEKTTATLKARAALLGVVLSVIDDDAGNEVFLVSREAYCRQLPSVAAVDDWLKLAGGPRA